MKNPFLEANYAQKLKKLENRLLRSIKRGAFFTWATHKQAQLSRRLQRYSLQLKQIIKPAIASVFLTLGLGNIAQGQSFTELTGASNPLDGVSLNSLSQPSFVDIDGDGDKDCFVGSGAATIAYYRNTGTNAAPSFSLQSGSNNPLNGVSIASGFVAPRFVDIDNDGDWDCFIGNGAGTVLYYQNTGSSSAATFTAQTGANNPLNAVNTSSSEVNLAFVDIDNDGDKDVTIGVYSGTILYYQNTGSSSAPAFTAQTGANNPLNGVDVGYAAAPAFVDIDNDNDFDLFIGENTGLIKYFLNSGSHSNPSFSEQTGANNPFNGVDVGTYAAPTFVDIDNDGDMDAFVGENSTNVNYFRNELGLAVSFSEAITNNLAIYPNPIESHGTVSVESIKDMPTKIVITDMLGKIVYSKNVTLIAGKQEIRLENLPLHEGIYLLIVNNQVLKFTKH